jgi:tetratricopeptide (TPR) repeat protein
MAEDVELDPALRSEIDRLLAQLDELDHYSLLGIARASDRKQVKSAYYAHASKIHPDRHFGKKLGPYKPKMEHLFGRMTIAHDTLSAAERRAEYDAYLAERDQLLAFERALVVDTESEPAEERPTAASRVVDSSQRMPAVATPSAPPTAESERIRREALARRLLGGGSQRRMPATSASTPAMRAATSAPPKPASAPPPTPTNNRVGVETLINSARNAASTGDLITASMRMRLAAKVDARYQAEAEELTRRAHAALADGYVKQARFEESESRWVAAAISWTKANEGRPNDPEIAERAANALRLAGGDLHKAGRLAEGAARLRPLEVRYRLTLVETYLAAGLLKRARSELDNALRVAPNDARAKSLNDDLRRRGG